MHGGTGVMKLKGAKEIRLLVEDEKDQLKSV